MTQAKLAQLADLSATCVAMIERGERRPMYLTVLRILDVLGEGVPDLMWTIEDMSDDGTHYDT